MAGLKKLPIGIENFEKLRQEDFYYIDKTRLIEQLLTRWGEVNLFTRPRRFGKSLNMSMLQSFFEIGKDKTLFDGLRISDNQELCEEYQGKFPVVSVSLKGINGATYEEARRFLIKTINEAEISTMQRLALKYPPSTRALLGAVLEFLKIGEPEILKKSLNAISTYSFPNIETILPTSKNWNIK